MKIIRRITAVLVSIVALTALGLSVFNTVSLNHKVTVLKHSVATERATIHKNQWLLGTVQNQVNVLEPLSAYAGMWCSTPTVDSLGYTTGATYSPCTTTHP
jgi:hypothetical protein